MQYICVIHFFNIFAVIVIPALKTIMTGSRLSWSATERMDEKFFHVEDLQDPHESTLLY